MGYAWIVSGLYLYLHLFFWMRIVPGSGYLSESVFASVSDLELYLHLRLHLYLHLHLHVDLYLCTP